MQFSLQLIWPVPFLNDPGWHCVSFVFVTVFVFMYLYVLPHLRNPLRKSFQQHLSKPVQGQAMLVKIKQISTLPLLGHGHAYLNVFTASEWFLKPIFQATRIKGTSSSGEFTINGLVNVLSNSPSLEEQVFCWLWIGYSPIQGFHVNMWIVNSVHFFFIHDDDDQATFLLPICDQLTDEASLKKCRREVNMILIIQNY